MSKKEKTRFCKVPECNEIFLIRRRNYNQKFCLFHQAKRDNMKKPFTRINTDYTPDTFELGI